MKRPEPAGLLIRSTSLSRLQVHVQRGMVRVMFAAALPESQAAGLYMIMAKGPGGDPYTGQLQPHDPTLTAHTYIRLLGRAHLLARATASLPWYSGLWGSANQASSELPPLAESAH